MTHPEETPEVTTMPDWRDLFAGAPFLPKLARAFVDLRQPRFIRLIEVRDWFSEKWFGFSGKTLGALGCWNSDELRIPPFHPNRVVRETALFRDQHGWRYETAPPLHIPQSSEQNLGRLASAGLPDETLLLWFGRPKADPGRLAVMTYLVASSGVTGWYASWSGDHLELVLGSLTRPMLESLLKSR